MIPNFTFLDPTLFSVISHGSVLAFFEDFGSMAISFSSGRYGPASGWMENGNFIVTFDSGSHTVEIVSAGTHSEPAAAETTFYNGTYLLALVNYGSFVHQAAAAISVGTGTYFECARVIDYGTESMPTDITFFEGAHNQVALGPSLAEHGTVVTTFGSGSYYNAQPDVDPMADKAVIRFRILPGEFTADLEFTTQGNPIAYNADYLEDHYIIVNSPSGAITFDTAWNGTSFDDRYQLLFDAPTFPPPSGAPPGIVIISNGTGTNVGTLTHEAMSLGCSVYNGTYFQMIVSGSIPKDIVPNFCTFLYGSHTFVQQTGSVTEDHGLAAITFGTGTYDLKVLTADVQENGNHAVTFYTGAHELVRAYATADSTVITADAGTWTADDCKPFSFDSGDWPSFDDATVFNFSQE